MKPIALILAAASSLAVVTTTPALAGHGGISQKEMVQKFVRIFDRLDRNNNGKLSRKALRRMEHRDRGHHDGPRVRVVFGDENFRIAFGTGGGGHRGGGSSYLGPINSRTFHIYDLNRDGVIYRRELRHAVRDEFRRADRNDDGYLSRREMNRSNWYRTSLSSNHDRYYPDYRRLDVRVGHGDRRHGHKANRHRDGHRDGHKADRRRDGHRDGHKADRRRDGHRDGHKADRRRDGHRDGHKANRQRDGHRDKGSKAKQREARDDRDRVRDDKKLHDRDEA